MQLQKEVKVIQNSPAVKKVYSPKKYIVKNVKSKVAAKNGCVVG